MILTSAKGISNDVGEGIAGAIELASVPREQTRQTPDAIFTGAEVVLVAIYML